MRHRVGPFVTIGAMGFVVQMATLVGLTTVFHWPYLPAIAVAVEAAIIHNFWWHERWTWRDRSTAAGTVQRLRRFHIGAGCISIAGNLAGTAFLVEYLHIGPLAANTAAVVATSLWNFVVADRWVFHTGHPGAREVLARDVML